MTIPSKTRKPFTRNFFAEHNYNYAHQQKTNQSPKKYTKSKSRMFTLLESPKNINQFSKANMEEKGLRVNMKKTKILVSGLGLDQLQNSGKYPCAVCRRGVRSNSIRCSQCKFWETVCRSGIFLSKMSW